MEFKISDIRNGPNFVSVDFITWEELETNLEASKVKVRIGLMWNC
jgi:hypothetical protein